MATTDARSHGRRDRNRPVRTRSACRPRDRRCHWSSDPGRPKSTRVDPTSKMAVVPVQGGDTLQHAVDPVSIPHDVGNRGVATGIDRKLNPQVSAPFGLRRRSQTRSGAPSQGGDTGSNPVGTTRSEAVFRRSGRPFGPNGHTSGHGSPCRVIRRANGHGDGKLPSLEICLSPRRQLSTT